MSGRDKVRGRDPDDWFSDLDQTAFRGEQAATAAPDPASDGFDGDDWLGDQPAVGPRSGGVPPFLRDRRIAALAAIVLAGCLVIAGLAIAGTFGGSKPHPTTTTQPPAAAQTTTGTTTTAPPATPAVAPAPTTTLKPGDQGAQVVVLQKALKALGHSPGAIDGKYGPITKSAIASFQTDARLTADGIFGPLTLAALRSALQGA
jgi:hypothetical protein